VIGVASRIIEEVRTRGDDALREYTAKFDKAEIEEFRVTDDEIEAAVAEVRPSSSTP
jgi:histidinol dehydrogenase